MNSKLLRNVIPCALLWAAAGQGVLAEWAPSFSTYQYASSVLGQKSWETKLSGPLGAASLYEPSGVAMDPKTGKLFVADRLNNRVLRYKNPDAYASGASAELVFGQADMSDNAALGAFSTTMSKPTGLVFDSSGRLYVADTGYNRVLRFDTPSGAMQNGPAADCVFGQPSAVSSQAGISNVKLASPSGVAADANWLWVADTGNHRVVGFQNPGTAATNTMSTTIKRVLGQSALNKKDVPVPPSASSMNAPEGVALSTDDASQRILWVSDSSNHRVLRFVDPASSADGAAADGVMGKGSMVTGIAPNAPTQTNLRSPAGLAVDESDLDGSGEKHVLYVVDRVHHRVMRFENLYGADHVAKTADDPEPGASATLVLGQPDFTSASSVLSARSFDNPVAIAIDPSAAEGSPRTLWVADRNDNRVLRFTPQLPMPAAPFVFGRPKYTTSKASITVKGGASAGVAIVSVAYKGRKGGFRPAIGTSGWSFKARLKVGKNRFTVVAYDALGRASGPVAVTVIRKP